MPSPTKLYKKDREWKLEETSEPTLTQRLAQRHHQLRSDNLVLVYQMGKVGSSSIEHTLNLLGIPSYHIHTFDDHEEFHMYRNRQDVRKFFSTTERAAYRLVLQYRKYLFKHRRNLNIITLVRDPIATVVSRFFQDLHIQFIEAKRNQAIHQDMKRTYEHLAESFEQNVQIEYFTKWFDNELKRTFNIDIFQHPVDQSSPCFTFEHQGVKVLLMKCERLNDLEEEIASFLSLTTITLHNSNEARNKWYSSLYEYFMQHYDFSKLFYLYDQPLYRHLYTNEELMSFKQRWQKYPGVTR